jgi:hypothetical protein
MPDKINRRYESCRQACLRGRLLALMNVSHRIKWNCFKIERNVADTHSDCRSKCTTLTQDRYIVDSVRRYSYREATSLTNSWQKAKVYGNNNTIRNRSHDADMNARHSDKKEAK